MKTFFKALILPLVGILLMTAPTFTKIMQVNSLAAIVSIGGILVLAFKMPVKNRMGHAAGVLTQQGLSDAYNKAYDACVAAYVASGETHANAQKLVDASVLSQSYLRLEILLTTTQNAYTLQVLDNQTNGGVPTRPTEKRLAQQDSFFINSIAIYIAKASSAADASFPLITFPDPVTFATGAASLYTLYNGYFNININKEVIVAGLPMSEYLQIPQTQLTAATNSPVTQFDPAQVGILQPNINFVGTKQSTFNFVLPSNMTTLDASTYLVVIAKGVLAQNITLMS